jgi:hypothetical protein
MNKPSQKQSSKRLSKIKSLVEQGAQPNKIEKIKNLLIQDDVSDDEDIKELDKLWSLQRLTIKQNERSKELSDKLTMKYGLKNGLWAKNLGQNIKCYPTLGQMRHDIVVDYSCKTSLEFMLADRIVANYWRAFNCDKVINRFMEGENGTFSYNQTNINLMKELNKGIEISERQLKADIILLKELKQPALKINVKSNTAFVSQNQQFNINPEEHENIEPK